MPERWTEKGGVEWITLGLIVGCYGLWLVALFWLVEQSLLAAIAAVAVLGALHSSLTHEVLHGHPFRSRRLNEALMFLPLTLAFPYNRFRDLHLAHHRDSRLTDPYDDPESNYLDPGFWEGMPRWKRTVFELNNTLLGRILIGPALGQARFMACEWKLAREGDRAVWLAWALHLAGVAIVLGIVAASPMPVWAYLVAIYAALGILKIRTFLEHRAHEDKRGRTVIVESRGPLAWLFLFNSLHVVHHMNPRAPWYDMPRLYRQRRDFYRATNHGYVYRSYAEIFRRYLLKAKDPVPHPLWRRG